MTLLDRFNVLSGQVRDARDDSERERLVRRWVGGEHAIAEDEMFEWLRKRDEVSHGKVAARTEAATDEPREPHLGQGNDYAGNPVDASVVKMPVRRFFVLLGVLVVTLGVGGASLAVLLMHSAGCR